MSFFINSAASQKTNVILKKFDDWNKWIMIIKTMIKRDDVERYLNLIKIVKSAESIKLDLSILFTIKINAINSTDLSIDEQRDLVILRKDYKNQMRRYKKKIDAVKNLNIFILTSVDRFNLIYLRNQKTIHQKLSALKKRLVSTNRIRRLEMTRKYKNLQKAFNINSWINDCWIERRFMQRQNDWIYLTLRRIDVRTIFWIRCARWICHLCLIKKRFWITRWIRKNLRRQ
jgi:hypothetical protein